MCAPQNERAPAADAACICAHTNDEGSCTRAQQLAHTCELKIAHLYVQARIHTHAHAHAHRLSIHIYTLSPAQIHTHLGTQGQQKDQSQTLVKGGGPQAVAGKSIVQVGKQPAKAGSSSPPSVAVLAQAGNGRQDGGGAVKTLMGTEGGGVKRGREGDVEEGKKKKKVVERGKGEGEGQGGAPAGKKARVVPSEEGVKGVSKQGGLSEGRKGGGVKAGGAKGAAGAAAEQAGKQLAAQQQQRQEPARGRAAPPPTGAASATGAGVQ